MQGQGKDATTEHDVHSLAAQHAHQQTMRCPHCGAPMRYQPNQRGAPSNQHRNQTHEDARAIKGVPLRQQHKG
jgi:hypothetical protein